MATLLRATGEITDVRPAKGAAFTLKELQAFVGGYIETVSMPANGVREYLVLNEDGKRLGLPYNRHATVLLHAAGGMPDDVCVGDALVATHIEMGDGDEEAE